MAPCTYSWASSTLAAQLGISPTSAAAMGWNGPMEARNAVIGSSPTPSNSRPSSTLNSRMNAKISSVCRSAEAQMPLLSSCSSWQSISSGWPA